MHDDDLAPMRLAIEASRDALAAGNMPFGATATRDGALLAVAQNNQVSTGDCTGHAETVLLRQLQAAGQADALRGATVYASGEPCAMCAGTLFWAGIRRLVFAASQADIAAALGAPLLPIGAAQVLAGAEPPVSVTGGVLAAEAVAVLRSAARG